MLIALIALLTATPTLAVEPDSADVIAQRAVRLLTARCISCHGSEKAEGQLRLDSWAALLRGGDNGPSFDVEKPAESLLLAAVKHTQPGLEMPPKDKLSAADVRLLETWLVAGAAWPKTIDTVAATEIIGDAWTDPRNPITQLFNGQRLDLWSLRPIQQPTPPALAAPESTDSPIDCFVAARRHAAGMTAAPIADRRTLARRLSFDLVGLPPTLERVAGFVADESPDAYDRYVDELLASPHYGEHWARLWLDVVRYSDSNGFDWDEFRPAAWRFRDYVVRALNADKPFDRFLAEQLAGDELLAGPPTTQDEQDALIATGYLRLGPQDNAAGLFDEQDRARAEWLADLTETTGSAFLGLTYSCCRCHDHKTDPLSQADHYRLRAFFAPIKPGDAPLDLADAQEAIRTQQAAVDERIAACEQQQTTLCEPVRLRLQQALRAKLAPAERELLARTADQLSEEERAKHKVLSDQTEPPEKDVIAALSAEQKAQHDELSEQIKTARREKPDFTKGLLATEEPGNVPVTHVFYQGDHQAPRDAVEPGFPSALAPQPATIVAAANAHTSGRRSALARWMTSADNPLTARVIVNRVWQTHFGQGIVATPNDFGLAGARPTHPELLDWLASDFRSEGWSLKRLHRQIVTSATYMQASFRSDVDYAARDADNQFYWRQNPRRLSAEQLRDALLSVSGQLLPILSGPPVWPELPADVLQANPAFLDDNETKTKGWYPSPPAAQGVRSLYLVQKRTVRVPFLETFDLPENSVSCARRTTSTVAPQALSLLNHALAVDAAHALAARTASEVDAGAEPQSERAFARTLQRKPTAEERRACAAFLATHTPAELCRALLNLNEFVWVD